MPGGSHLIRSQSDWRAESSRGQYQNRDSFLSGACERRCRSATGTGTGTRREGGGGEPHFDPDQAVLLGVLQDVVGVGGGGGLNRLVGLVGLEPHDILHPTEAPFVQTAATVLQPLAATAPQKYERRRLRDLLHLRARPGLGLRLGWRSAVGSQSHIESDMEVTWLESRAARSHARRLPNLMHSDSPCVRWLLNPGKA